MTRIIGSIVLAVIIMAIPILWILSFEQSWHAFFRWILTVVAVAELVSITNICYSEDI